MPIVEMEYRKPCRGVNKKNGFPQQGLFVFAICGLP